MDLTGKEIVENGIITGPVSEGNIAQHGVDLNIKSVRRIASNDGAILKEKTLLPKYEEVTPTKVKFDKYGERECFVLKPGMYDISFEQGCNIPKDQRMFLVQRSSIMRNGAIVNSSMFDAGFKTDEIGTFICVFETLTIEVGARVVQAFCEQSNEVMNLYNGQFQKDKQRK